MKTAQLSKRGFTLIELLVVIGILAVLLAITLIAINPAKQFAQANNTKRRSDVNAILNAIDQYAADHKGALPQGVPTSALPIQKTGGNNTDADICSDLVTKYLAALPVDPLTNGGAAITDCSQNYSTDYDVVQSQSDNRVTVTAPRAELNEVITVTR
ncbi:MAG TPA: type II secretion system protein [Patescibacteria group bacterium]|nr:type II secretion system protein [Patescibacteria group bacterium]